MPSTIGGPATFTIAIGQTSPTTGTCNGSVTSSAGGTPATFAVTVTQTIITIQSRERR
jgi:hypothetical protein